MTFVERMRLFGVPEDGDLGNPDARCRIAFVGWYAMRELERMPSGRYRHGKRLSEYAPAAFLAIAVSDDGRATGFMRVGDGELSSEAGEVFVNHIDLAYVRYIDRSFDDAIDAALGHSYEDLLQWLEDNQVEEK